MKSCYKSALNFCYKFESCVQDLSKVTVGGLSWEISDSEVLKYLSNFGDFSRLPKDITYCKDGRGYWSGERVYTANNIAIEISSYSTVFGKLLTIRYKDQPPTCRLCDSRDHKGFDCPLNPNLRRRNHRDSTSVMNGSAASQDNSNSTQIGEPVKDASQSTGGQGDIANVQKDQDDAASVQNMQNGNLASENVVAVSSAPSLSNVVSAPQASSTSQSSISVVVPSSSELVVAHASVQSFASVVSSVPASVTSASTGHLPQAAKTGSEQSKPAILKFLRTNPLSSIKIVNPPSGLNKSNRPKSSRVGPYKKRRSSFVDTIPHTRPDPVFDVDVYDADSFPKLLYPQSGSLKSPLDRNPQLGVKKIPEAMKDRAKRSKLSAQENSESSLSQAVVGNKVDEVHALLSEDQVNPSESDPERMEVVLTELQSMIDKVASEDDNSSTAGEVVSSMSEDSHKDKSVPSKREILHDMFDYDMSLLKNCHAKAAGGSSSNVTSSDFKDLIHDQINKLDFVDDDSDDSAPSIKRDTQVSVGTVALDTAVSDPVNLPESTPRDPKSELNSDEANWTKVD